MTLNRALRARPRRDSGVAPRLSVGFLLLKNFTLCAFANFIDVLRLAADEGDRSRQIRCQWRVISADSRPIQSSCGVTIQPNELIGDLDRFDYIVVVGGMINDETYWQDERINEHLHRAAALGIPLVGLCTGSLFLHQAGLMDGYRCCVSWFHDSDFMQAFVGLKAVTSQIFVVDRDRLTCSGGASTAHLAAFLVERHLGKVMATKSLRIMMIDEAARAESPQPAKTLDIPVRDEVVKRALLLMQQYIDTPLSIEQISAHMQVDRKNIERRFRLTIGTSPLAAYTHIRLEHACHLLTETNKRIADIAVECGFCDSSHLGRIFRRRFGLTPHEFRLTQADGGSKPALSWAIAS